MVIMKQLLVECSKCGWSDELAEFDDDWDKYLELEDNCPGCNQRVLDAL